MESDVTPDIPQPTPMPLENAPSQIISSHMRGIYLFIIVGIILLVLVAGVAYMYGKNSSVADQQNMIRPIVTTVTPVVTEPTPTMSSVLTTRDTAPSENVLYFGSYEGEEAIFFTNAEQHKYYESGVEKTNPYIGMVYKASGAAIHPFNYKKLTDPKPLNLTLQAPVQAVISIMQSETKGYLYISLNLEEKSSSQYPDNLVNHVYQINLKDMTAKDIWSNEVGSDKYPGKGVVLIDQVVSDQYVTLKLGECYACGGHTHTKTIVVNVGTKNEKYMGEVGDMKFDLTAKTFTYKKLEATKEACDPSPECDENGQMTVMKPAGSDFTEALP